jgi:hypothetical protein
VTSDLPVHPADLGARFNQTVAQALVIPFRVIVLEELTHSPPQGLLPEEDHAIQALVLDASHESLHVCIVLSCRVHPIRIVSNEVSE